MNLRERKLRRNGNRLDIVKSAEADRIIIPFNGRVVIEGYLGKILPYHKVLVMPQATHRSSIPADLDIVPSLYPKDFNQCCSAAIEVSNVNTRSGSASPKTIICELQTVTIQDMVLSESATSHDVCKAG